MLSEFQDYLRCGRLEYGFVRVKCNGCRHEHLVAFSCKRRGFCPSCGARRMIETSAHLVDQVFPEVPIRQWVLSFPWSLHLLFASRPEALGRCLAVIVRAIQTDLTHRAGLTASSGARTGVITLIQRFGSALNLNIHLHMLILDGVYTLEQNGPRFHRVERLCRYITRPALCVDRLSTNAAGQVVYQLKNPFRDGTTHVLSSPGDFIGRLAALVPRPRVNLTRYHGVFEIDITLCPLCGGQLPVIANVTDPDLIRKILDHVQQRAPPRLPPRRAESDTTYPDLFAEHQ